MGLTLFLVIFGIIIVGIIIYLRIVRKCNNCSMPLSGNYCDICGKRDMLGEWMKK